MTAPIEVAGQRRIRAGDGWCALVLGTAAQTYLVFVLSLAAIALLPLLLGWHGTVVQSGSMEPHISAGDIVLATSLPETSPVPVGGVVEYQSPAAAEPSGTEKLRLHRIVTANTDGTFVTAGDANRDVDSTPITREQIMGQARLLVPLIGLPSLWIGTGNHLPLLLWMALTAVALALAVRRGAAVPARVEASHRPEPISGSRLPGTITRAALIVLIGSTAVAGLMALPHPGSSAAFSARTAAGSNAWTVRTLPVLTPGLATPYALLGAVSIVNDGPPGQLRVDGGVGTTPGTTITGLKFVSGSTEPGSAAARNAMVDAAGLYNAGGARSTTGVVGPSLTGAVGPGVYESADGRLTVTGDLILDARGDPSAVFIFSADSLVASASSTVTLVNGASAENVYWRASGTILLDGGTTNVGTYLATRDLVMRDGSTVEGRLVSLIGSITLSRAVVSLPR